MLTSAAMWAQELSRQKYSGDKIADEFVEFQRYDADLCRKRKETSGYMLYIGKNY